MTDMVAHMNRVLEGTAALAASRLLQRNLNRPAVIDCALEPIDQDQSAIDQGERERLEIRAKAIAGIAVEEAIRQLQRLGRPVTANSGDGLARIAINAYQDTMRRGR